jgi:transcriptional regulator
MYIPPHFAEPDVARIHACIRACKLGTLVTRRPLGIDANHIPFVLHTDPAPNGTLRGHVARANPVWREHEAGVEALVIFQGPDAYISPAWYPSTARTGEAVPTWNYVAVHAHGPLEVIDDPTWIRAHLEELTESQEARRAERWRVSDAPPDYVDAMARGVIGIEIRIARLLGKWKVSQNRSEEDRRGVVAGLGREETPAADAMASLVKSTLPR